MAVYQGFKSDLLKSQRAYLPNDIIFEFDDNKTNKVRMKVGKMHQAEIYRRLPYVSCLCECHGYGQGFVTDIGNNRDREYTINHNLNSEHVIVQIYDNTTNLLSDTEINLIDSNNVKAIFNNVPRNNQYRVLVYSTPYYTDPGIGNEEDLNYEIEHNIGTSDLVLSLLNLNNKRYEYSQIKNVDSSDDKVEISFEEKIHNNQYLVSMEAGNYSQTVTLTSTSEKTFRINHNLDCRNIIVQMYDLTFKRRVYSKATVKIIDNSNVEISFSEYNPEEFKDRCRIRIVLLDVRHVDCCYHIDANDIREVKESKKDDIPVIVDWVPGEDYLEGQIVKYNDRYYECINATSNHVTDEDDWKEVNLEDLDIKKYN